ncbi:MAG: 4'-phosphopantetheinyl transferase superfamily protein [Lachnospiraceae bacterium]|nr:4'-phosphopantetheinyl transferase superfamily protein [Lachnospiraceae bacterium]
MRVYVYDISSLRMEDMHKYYDILPKWRRDKIDKCSKDEDKLRSLGAGLVLAYALNEQGIKLDDCKISFSKNDKPYIQGIDDIHFNISHSGDRVVVGVSKQPLGIDIQQVRPVNLRLADRHFTGKEDEYINNEVEKFHEIWCLKESYLKCIGIGLTIPLKDIEIIPNHKMSIGDYELHLRSIDGYKLGICTSKYTNIEIYYLDNIKI